MAKKFVYISPDASRFSCRMDVAGKDVHVQFVDSNFSTDDAALAEALDAAIAEGHISRWVRKVDMAAAEKLVQEHIAQRNATGAQAGQATTAGQAGLAALQARDQKLHAIPNGDEVAEKVADEADMLLTEEAPPNKPGIKFGTQGNNG